MPGRGLAYVVGPWTELPEQAKRHWGEYYDEIGKSLRAAAFEPFLAHREIAPLPPAEIPGKLRAALRRAKLVVMELSLDSPDARLILGRVRRSRRKASVVVLRHVSAVNWMREDELFPKVRVVRVITYKELDEGVVKLRRFLTDR